MLKKILTASVTAFSLFVVGCGTTDPTSGPSVTLDAIGTLGAGSGAAKTVAGKIEADEAITSVSYSIVNASGAAVAPTVISVTGPAADNTKKMTISVTIQALAGAVAGEYKLQITATAGAESTTSFLFSVTGTAANPVTPSSVITLGAHDNATLGSSLDLDNGTVMLASAARAAGLAADIIYTYSSKAPAGPVLMSPAYAKASSGITAFETWATPFDTKFHKVTTAGVTYDGITTDVALKALYSETAATTTAGRLNVIAGDLVVVLTSEGKYALMNIITVSADATGTATIKYAK